MTPRTSPISAASTFFYGSPDRRRRGTGRRKSKHPSPQPERRPQRAQAWKAFAVRGTSYASSVEVGIPNKEPPSYRGLVRRKPILLALIFSAFFVLKLTGASSAPPTVVAPVLSASVSGTEVSLTWTDAGGENSYYVMRLPPAAVTWTQVAQLRANSLQYKDWGLSTSMTYHYVVVATRGWKQISSNAVQITTGVTPSLAAPSPSPSPSLSLAGSPSSNPSPSPSPSSYPSLSPSPSPRPSPSPSPSPAPGCNGIQVAAGADLRAVMDAVTTPATFCLAAGTYELGANSLHFDGGDVIVGQPVTFGPTGEVIAPTKIHGTATTGVIQALTGQNTLTLDGLDICCSPSLTGDNTTGRGINGNAGKLVNATVLNSRIHGNGSEGIGGVGQGLIVDHSEIDHNGSGNGGIDAGIKTVHYAEIRNSYIHDNDPQGMWWDCDAPGGIVENSTVEANARAGVEVEISSGDANSRRPLPPWGSYGFTIRNNYVEGNNTSNTAPYAGIYVTSSMNVNVDGNTVINNTGQNIRVQNDSRAGQGHNGCSSGFFSANDVAQNNQYGPLDITDCTLAGVTCSNSTKIL